MYSDYNFTFPFGLVQRCNRFLLTLYGEGPAHDRSSKTKAGHERFTGAILSKQLGFSVSTNMIFMFEKDTVNK